MRMAHGTLQEFDANKESIEDFHQIFEFYCPVNNIKEGNEAQRNYKKALFITLVGQATFAKLRDSASPCAIADILLDDIMELLKTYYRPQTVQILDYKQNTAPRTFHKKVHNVAVNPFVSKLSLMKVKLALLHLFCIKGFICLRNISISNTYALKGFFCCHYPNSCDIT